MIIDFHTHIFPDKIAGKTISILSERASLTPSTDATLDGLLASMKEAGIDISVVLPVVTKPSQFDSVNAFAAEVNRERGIISFGGIHPDCENVEEKIEFLAAQGFRGIKLHPDYQDGVYIDDERYIRIIKHALYCGLLVITHAGLDVGFPDPVHCTPERSARMLDAVYPGGGIGEARIIFAHSGGHAMGEDVKKYLCQKNVWFDLAFTLGHVPLGETADIIRAHGAERILFATDSPWSSQARDVERVKKLGLTEDELELILWKNAAGLLGLTEDQLREKSLLQCV